MPQILVLGPQYRTANLRVALERAGIEGPPVAITAGWQEREGELGALEEHLGCRVRDLRLYERAEGVFAQDPEFHAAYRERQQELRTLQDLYRGRLGHAKAAARELLEREDDSDALRAARREAIAALRRLDAWHLRAIERVHQRFESRWSPARHPLLARQHEELRHLLEGAGWVCIAGGHVAVLLYRLRLFGVGSLLKGKTVVAWSAGAMALAERVVLFHDHPPQGAGSAEIFEAGLGLVRGVVFLPHARKRLALDDRRRVALFARRFGPAACHTLDEGSVLHWRRGALRSATGTSRLLRSGGIAPLEAGP
jgi:hypothetical protein